MDAGVAACMLRPPRALRHALLGCLLAIAAEAQFLKRFRDQTQAPDPPEGPAATFLGHRRRKLRGTLHITPVRRPTPAPSRQIALVERASSSSSGGRKGRRSGPASGGTKADDDEKWYEMSKLTDAVEAMKGWNDLDGATTLKAHVEDMRKKLPSRKALSEHFTETTKETLKRLMSEIQRVKRWDKEAALFREILGKKGDGSEPRLTIDKLFLHDVGEDRMIKMTFDRMTKDEKEQDLDADTLRTRLKSPLEGLLKDKNPEEVAEEGRQA